MTKKYPAKPIKTQKQESVSSKKEAKPKVLSSVTSTLQKNDWIWIALIAVLSFFLYANTLKFGNTFDDDIYTQKNKFALQGMSALGDIWKYGTIKGFTVDPNNSGIYRPFTLTTFAMEKSLFGNLDPGHSHGINVFLYALTILALGAFLVKLCKNIGIPVYVPLLITLLYATHPLHTEVVASVKSRDEILAMLLPLLGMNLLWTYLREKNLLWLILACVSFLFGLFSKENPLMMMFLIPVFLYIFAKKTVKDSIITALPFIGMGVLYLLIRTSVLDKVNSSGVNMVINNVVWGAKGAEIYSTNLSVWLEYLRLLFIPWPLSYDYSFNQVPMAGWGEPRVWVSLVLYLSIALGGAWLAWKKQFSGLGLLFYLVTFFIYMNLIPKYVLASTMAERFMFMPSLGFCIFVVSGLYLLLEKFSIKPANYIMIGVFSAVSLVYSVLTVQRNPVWENNITLFQSGTGSAPKSFRTHFNMGETLRVKGDEALKKAQAKNDQNEMAQARKIIAESAGHYENSLKIYDKVPLTWYNLGICYTALNDTVKAEAAYLKSYELFPKGMASNNLGVIRFWKKDYENAAKYFEVALQGSNPEKANILSNLGASYHNQGKYADAIKYYEQALAISPTPNLIQNLSNLYKATGNPEKADYYAKMMGQLTPNAQLQSNPSGK